MMASFWLRSGLGPVGVVSTKATAFGAQCPVSTLRQSTATPPVKGPV